MKKVNNFMNILIFVLVSVLVMRAILSYINYTRHIALFAVNGWLWYEDVFVWGKYIVPVMVVCVIVKMIVSKKMQN
jgi:hypothetical protein